MNSDHPAVFEDEMIMAKVRDGKVEMLALLFERHHKKLFNFLLRLTNEKNLSEDLVQDVFFRILKYRATYEGRSKFSVWMYQIARNVFHDYLRKNHPKSVLENYQEEVDPRPLPGEQIAQEQDVTLLKNALAQLPMKKREILLLSRFENLKYHEIADLMQCSLTSVKVQVHRALKDLRQIYNELSRGTA